MNPKFVCRRAGPEDAAAIARIYNEGIEDRVATFETTLRTEADVTKWFERPHPIVVVEERGAIVAFAAASPSSPRACYARNAEFSIYVARSARRTGAGRVAMSGLVDVARQEGFMKLLSGVFPENAASRALLRETGFREIGVHERHGQLEGRWLDVILVERLL